jgi:hypothetical protein
LVFLVPWLAAKETSTDSAAAGGIKQPFTFVQRLDLVGGEIRHDGDFHQGKGGHAFSIYGEKVQTTVVATDRHNRIYAAGIIYPQAGGNAATSDLFVYRLTEAGALDTTFANQGISRLHLPHEGFFGILPRQMRVVKETASRDALYLAGSVELKQQTGTFISFPFVMRLTDDGAPDHRFGEEGAFVFHDFSSSSAQGLHIDDNQRCHVAIVQSAGTLTVLRLAANGTPRNPDQTASVQGKIASTHANRLLDGGNDRMIFAGRLIDPDTPRQGGTLAARFKDDGTLDASFGTAGIGGSTFNTGFPVLADAAPGQDAYFYTLSKVGLMGWGFEAWTTDGGLEEQFSGDGKRVLRADFPTFQVHPQGLAVDRTGNADRIYAVGTYQDQTSHLRRQIVLWGLRQDGTPLFPASRTSRPGLAFFNIFADSRQVMFDLTKLEKITTGAITTDSQGRPVIVGDLTAEPPRR